jgi:hypothetical protein
VIYVIGAVSGLVVGLLILSVVLEQMRRSRLKEVALERDGEYFPTWPPKSRGDDQRSVDEILLKFKEFSPFGVGHSRRVSHLIKGREAGRKWMTFGYSYKTGEGKETKHHGFLIGVVSGGIQLDELEAWSNVYLSTQGIELDGKTFPFENAALQRQFRVKASSDQFRKQVLSDEMMRHCSEHCHGILQMKGSTIIQAEPPGHGWMDAYDARLLHKSLTDILERLPDCLKEDLSR